MLRQFKKDKGIWMKGCYIDSEQNILGLSDGSEIFNVIVPAGWTIKRYHGNFPRNNSLMLEEMLENPYLTEILTEDRIFD